MRGLYFFYFFVFITIFSLLSPDFDRRLYGEGEREREKRRFHCHRQSFLFSKRFPSMLNRWRTEITSISTSGTYRSINAPATSFLAEAQPVFKLEKNCRKVGRGGGDAPLIRKTVIPAKIQSSCQNRDGWHHTLPQPKKQQQPKNSLLKSKRQTSSLKSGLYFLYWKC